MINKKPKPGSAVRRQILRREQQLKAIKAQIARLDNDTGLNLAAQDHFILWRRPSLFAPWSSGLQ
jgi:hypothetical protein